MTWNPVKAILNAWDGRKIQKIKDQYRYSLQAYANKHSATREKDDKFLIAGFVGYFGVLAISAYLNAAWLMPFSIPVLFLSLFMPIFGSVYEQWKLKSLHTITLKIIPNTPEETRPFTVRLEGVTFGTEMKTPEKLIEFINENKGHLTHAFTHSTNGTAKNVIDAAKAKQMSLYPMWVRGDPVPTLVMSKGDPEMRLRPREEKIRIGYGMAKLRHSTAYVLECKPVSTSIRARNKILDVEFALFSFLMTQTDIDEWLQTSEWHVPTRLVEMVADFVKINADRNQNASYFEMLERQRDQAMTGREKLQIANKNEQMNADLDGKMMDGYKKIPGRYSLADVIPWLIVAFVAGCSLMYMVLGG